MKRCGDLTARSLRRDRSVVRQIEACEQPELTQNRSLLTPHSYPFAIGNVTGTVVKSVPAMVSLQLV